MATQSEAHVAQMHASASDPARAGKGGRGAHAQAGPECSAAAPRCITEACAPGRVSAAARACACTAGPHLPGSRRRVLPKALARQTLRARQHGRRSAPPSSWRTRLPLAVAHAGTRGRAAAVRTAVRVHARAFAPVLPPARYARARRNQQCSTHVPCTPRSWRCRLHGADVCVCGSYTNRSARRAKATTASSDCRPRPTVPDRVRHCIVKFGWAERESAFVDGLRERVLFVLEISWGTATHALLKKNSRRQFDRFGRWDDEQPRARAIERAHMATKRFGFVFSAKDLYKFARLCAQWCSQ